MNELPELTIAHSPDPDDVFMWWPLGSPDREPRIETEGFRFVPVMDDIEALNGRAVERGDLDITAISVHAYPYVKDRYAMTACGASMGRSYGPKVVAREDRGIEWLRGSDPLVAVPGTRTTAFLALRLLMERTFRHVVIPFDEIAHAVSDGRADAGVVIHEAQLTYPEHGLHLIEDLGSWWMQMTGLPLPLGANAVRLDLEERLGAGSLGRLTRVLDRSIRFARDHNSEALEIAQRFACDENATPGQVAEFVSMYVNELSQDSGEEGARAIERLLTLAHERGISPDPQPIRIIEAAPAC